MYHFSSLVLAFALVSLPLAVSAQTRVPIRTAVAVEAPAPSTQSQSPASTQPAAPSPDAQQQEEESAMVLFTGTVKQDKLKALPGATVYVRSTRQMAVADENGDFSLELDFSRGPLELEVSYAGYADQSLKITDPNTFLVVSMQNRKKK